MSAQEKEIKCQGCSAYLFEEDDTVYCPVCGAPHHRECYNALGHCALEQLHGTQHQYDKLRQKNEEKQPGEQSESANPYQVKCGMCGETYDAQEKNCPNCATPNTTRMGRGYISFDFLGGIDGNTDLGDGVTADEAKRFVGANSYRYIPKFAAMKNGKKASWNWLAFISPCGWLLSRKMYKWGIFVGVLTIAFSLLSYPFQNQLINMAPTDVAADTTKLARWFIENISSVDMTAFFAAVIGTLSVTALSILCGIFGDYMYRNHAIEKIKYIKENSDDEEYDIVRCGGVNFFALLAGFFATQYLTAIIATFLL